MCVHGHITLQNVNMLDRNRSVTSALERSSFVPSFVSSPSKPEEIVCS